jgi:poly(3-hydroxybutyrate) depolymerase
MAPLSGHHATLLKGTVQSLLPNHDVYITDWKDARDIPASEGSFDMDDYVTTVLGFMEKLGANTHILAVCQPSVQALLVTALLADTELAPSSVTIMAGPIDTRINPTPVNRFAGKYSLEQFRQRAICTVPFGYAGEGRKVYPGFLQLVSFMSMNMRAHINRTIGFIDDLAHGKEDQANDYREFYDEYLAVMDMPAEFYLECIDKIFQKNELARGVLTYKGEVVDLAKIKRSALFTVEGEKDDITGTGQTEAAHGLCSGLTAKKRDHYVQKGAGHYGVFNGFRFRNGILPKVEAFIAKHDAA